MNESKLSADNGEQSDDVFYELLDQLSERLQAGETLSWDSIYRDQPQHAERLKRIVPTLQSIAELGQSTDSITPTPHLAGTNSSICGEVLGDFRIVREIGRGGMGVVYEAEQMSIGRKVALKTLPFAAVLDHKQLQRFKHEAQTAGLLKHPNIVGVYSVGCERGVHYYAMEMIQGGSLADLITSLKKAERQTQDAEIVGDRRTTGQQQIALSYRDERETAEPSHAPPPDRASTETQPIAALSTQRETDGPSFFGSVAQLAVQAAEALEHAHQSGIVHRDVKPSNLLLDTQGQLWVADFGLAMTQAGQSITITGDLVGTLRYMSPEQALAKRVIIDHRTDIYSLGATLYELLTLQPMFRGHDAQELMRQIAFEEPPRLRRLSKLVPVELETIVLKATAKDPSERYTTAQELANDLRRFLENKPIVAKRPTIMQHVSKWSQRNRSLVAAGVAFLVLTAIVTSISAVQMSVERRRAEANFDKTRQVVDQFVVRIAEDLHGVPEMTETRVALLRDAMEFYEWLLEQKSTDHELRHATAMKMVEFADHSGTKLGNVKEAQEILRKAVRELEILAAAFPDQPQYQFDLAAAYDELAFRLFRDAENTVAEGLELTQKRIAIYEQLIDQYPNEVSYREQLAGAYFASGWGQNNQVNEQVLRKSLRVWDSVYAEFPNYVETDPWGSANCHHYLGRLLMRTNRFDEAEHHLREALAIRQRLLNGGRMRKGIDARPIIAQNNSLLGDLFLEKGMPAEAETFYRVAIALSEEATKEFPDIAHNRQTLVHFHLSLAEALAQMGRVQEQEAALRRSIAIGEQLAEERPGEFSAPALNYYKLGLLLHDSNQPEAAVDAFRKANECFGNEDEMGTWTLQLLGEMLANCPASRFRDPDRAVSVIQESIRLNPNGGDSSHWFLLAIAECHRNHLDEARKWYDQAVQWMDENKPNDHRLQSLRTEAAQLLGMPNALDADDRGEGRDKEAAP